MSFLFDDKNCFSFTYQGTGFWFWTAMASLPIMMIVAVPCIVLSSPFVLIGAGIYNIKHKKNVDY